VQFVLNMRFAGRNGIQLMCWNRQTRVEDRLVIVLSPTICPVLVSDHSSFFKVLVVSQVDAMTLLQQTVATNSK
jgi:hypothetical protein